MVTLTVVYDFSIFEKPLMTLCFTVCKTPRLKDTLKLYQSKNNLKPIKI